MKKVKIDVEFYKKLNKEHLEGKSLLELCSEYNIKYTTLYNGFRKNNLELKQFPEKKIQKYQVNHDFFEVIDSEIKAYLLGWLMADGYIMKKGVSKTVAIKLQEGDVEILNLFTKFISERKLHKEVRKDAVILGRNVKETTSLLFSVTSEKMYFDLINHGLFPNKTMVGETFCNLEDEFMRHFIRGYFDGDGGISLSVRNRSTVSICSVHRPFMDKLQAYMLSKNIKCTIHTEDRKAYKTMYRLHFNDRVKFFSFLYENHNYSLQRKFLKYNHINTVLTSKIKKLEAV